MQEGHDCCNCLSSLGDATGVVCIVCLSNVLCDDCVRELAVCVPCKNSQFVILSSSATALPWRRRITHRVCAGCTVLSMANQSCARCMHTFCPGCRNNTTLHSCVRCNASDCNNVMYAVCCENNWCWLCLEKHRQTNCKLTCKYNCDKCAMMIYTFGNEALKCPFQECPQKYGCTRCSSGWKERGWTGVYCSKHLSYDACSLCCQQPFPVREARHVCFPRLMSGSRYWWCGQCYRRLSTLVKCIIYVGLKDRHIKLLPVLIESILLMARDILKIG
jgi:hypothetical protein